MGHSLTVETFNGPWSMKTKESPNGFGSRKVRTEVASVAKRQASKL